MAFTKFYDPGTAFLLGQVGGAGWVVGTSFGPESYDSTSFPVAASSLGLSAIYFAQGTSDGADYRPYYDYHNDRINVYTYSRTDELLSSACC